MGDATCFAPDFRTPRIGGTWRRWAEAEWVAEVPRREAIAYFQILAGPELHATS